MHVGFSVTVLKTPTLCFVRSSVVCCSCAGRETYGWTWCDLDAEFNVSRLDVAVDSEVRMMC